jgi:tetratricopeptide (TPR) repeat protein
LAERTLRVALSRNPNDGEALAALGALLLEAGKLEEAADVLTRAASLAPNAWKIHFGLGQARLRLGRHEEALKYFVAARKLNPQPPADILGKIALCYIVLGRGEDAGATLADLNPSLPAAAVAVLEREKVGGALDLDTASLRTLATLALICRKHGALAPVVMELWRRREGQPTPEEMTWLPAILASRGKTDDAARVYLDGPCVRLSGRGLPSAPRQGGTCGRGAKVRRSHTAP